MKAKLVGGAVLGLAIVISPGVARAEGTSAPVAVEPAPAGAETQRAKLGAALRADARSKLPGATAAFLAKLKSKDAAFTPDGAARDALASTGNLGFTTKATTDIEALVFVVLLEGAKAAEEDLRAVMEEVKEINRHKQAVREAIAQCKRDRGCLKEAKPPVGLAKASFDKLVGLELDGGSETKQLHLQILTDRRKTMMQTLSNLLKKWGDTAGAIVSNMK